MYNGGSVQRRREEDAIFPIQHIDPSIEGRLSPGAFFEHYRLVDTETYLVYDYRDGRFLSHDDTCYRCWSHGRPCTNCVSRIAVRENRQVVKLETLGRSIFLIVTIPFGGSDRKFALEFIKNVTDDLMVADIETDGNVTAVDLVDRINELTVRHPSTGLLRKEYAERELGKLVAQWDGTSPTTLCILDIDRSKQVNDEHGHLVGDEVLARVSQLLLESAEHGGGWASRIGGDEFMLVLPSLPKDKADTLTEALEAGIAACKYQGTEPFPVTVSHGAARLDARHGSWRDLFAEADRAMYAAKQARR